MWGGVGGYDRNAQYRPLKKGHLWMKDYLGISCQKDVQASIVYKYIASL